MDPLLITSPTDGRHRVWDPVRGDFVGVWEPDQRHLAEGEVRRLRAKTQRKHAKRRAAAPPPRALITGPFAMRVRAEAFLPVDASRPYAQEFSHGWLVWNPITRAWSGRKGLGALAFQEVHDVLEDIARRMNGGPGDGR